MFKHSTSLKGFNSEYESSIHLREVRDKDEPRSQLLEMRNDIKWEVADLLRRGKFQVMLEEEVPNIFNALMARFELVINSTDDNEVKYKAR